MFNKKNSVIKKTIKNFLLLIVFHNFAIINFLKQKNEI